VNTVSWAHSLANAYLVTTGSSDGTIQNHDVRVKHSIVNTIYAHKGEVAQVAWSNVGHDPNSIYLASSSYQDSALGIWSLRDLLQGQPNQVNALLWHDSAVVDDEIKFLTDLNMPIEPTI
jgi:WD40 repeat protein